MSATSEDEVWGRGSITNEEQYSYSTAIRTKYHRLMVEMHGILGRFVVPNLPMPSSKRSLPFCGGRAWLADFRAAKTWRPAESSGTLRFPYSPEEVIKT